MKRLLRFVLICLVFETITQCAAQDSSYQTMSDKFFNLVEQGKASDAMEYLLATNPAMKKVPDQTEQLKAQFASAVPLLGPYISHTMLVETKVAGMFVYQHYFVAYERQPYRSVSPTTSPEQLGSAIACNSMSS